MSTDFASSRPRKGDPITCRGKPVGTVSSVDGNICYGIPQGGGAPGLAFIWRFKDGLNNLHDWPGKDRTLNAPVTQEGEA